MLSVKHITAAVIFNIFFSVLATTGAASIAQLRRFFLECFDFTIVCFYQREKCFTVFVEPLRSHCFLSVHDYCMVIRYPCQINFCFALIKKQWENQKTRERIAAPEAAWRIPSPPIVEKNLLKMTAAVIKHDVNHLLIRKTMGTQRLDKNGDLLFCTDKKYWENQKTPEIIRASEGTWRIPSPLIVEKNLLKMAAAVIKHGVNHFSRENNENATARQKP